MRFVFKLDEPFFRLAVDCHRHFNGTGVDFLAFVKVGDQPALFQKLHTGKRHIHQRNIPVRVLAVNLIARVIIGVERLFYHAGKRALFYINLLKPC